MAKSKTTKAPSKPKVYPPLTMSDLLGAINKDFQNWMKNDASLKKGTRDNYCSWLKNQIDPFVNAMVSKFPPDFIDNFVKACLSTINSPTKYSKTGKSQIGSSTVCLLSTNLLINVLKSSKVGGLSPTNLISAIRTLWRYVLDKKFQNISIPTGSLAFKKLTSIDLLNIYNVLTSWSTAGHTLVYDKISLYYNFKFRLLTQLRITYAYDLRLYEIILSNNGMTLGDYNKKQSLWAELLNNIIVAYKDPKNPSFVKLEDVESINIDITTNTATVQLNGSTTQYDLLTATNVKYKYAIMKLSILSGIDIDHIVPISWFLQHMTTVNAINSLWVSKYPKKPSMSALKLFYTSKKTALSKLAPALCDELFCQFSYINLQLMEKFRNSSKGGKNKKMPIVTLLSKNATTGTSTVNTGTKAKQNH
jgi:hypothetical protein